MLDGLDEKYAVTVSGAEDMAYKFTRFYEEEIPTASISEVFKILDGWTANM